MKAILNIIKRAFWDRESLFELSSLNDRQLQDIGFSRSQMPVIGAGAVDPAALHSGA